MIGGETPYDPETGGGPADGRPQPPQPPQQSQQDQLSQPLHPFQQRQPWESAERAAGTEPAPPPGPAPAPAAWPPAPAPTGDERVDAALSRFEKLAAAPVADHVEVFEDLQRRLQDVLASVDHDEQPDMAAPQEPSDAAPRPGPGPRPAPPNRGS